jgi:hypothetical protein
MQSAAAWTRKRSFFFNHACALPALYVSSFVVVEPYMHWVMILGSSVRHTLPPGAGARSRAFRKQGLLGAPLPLTIMIPRTVSSSVPISRCTRCASIAKRLLLKECSDGVWKWNCRSSRFFGPMFVMHDFSGKSTCMCRKFNLQL